MADLEQKAEPSVPAAGTSVSEVMKHRLATAAGKQKYKLRQQMVEPVFGIIKSVLGFRRFLLRGLPLCPLPASAHVFTVKAGMPLAARPSLSKYRRCSSHKMGVLKFPIPSNFGESYAQASGEIQPRTDEGIHRRYAWFAFPGVADRSIAGAGDDCPLLAGDAI